MHPSHVQILGVGCAVRKIGVVVIDDEISIVGARTKGGKTRRGVGEQIGQSIEEQTLVDVPRCGIGIRRIACSQGCTRVVVTTREQVHRKVERRLTMKLGLAVAITT